MQKKIASEIISTPYIKYEDWLADTFTKLLSRQHIQRVTGKLGNIDIYAPTQRKVLDIYTSTDSIQFLLCPIRIFLFLFLFFFSLMTLT